MQPRKTRTDIIFKDLTSSPPPGELIGKLMKNSDFVEHERYIAFGPINCDYKFSTMSGAAAAASTEFKLISRYFENTGLTQFLEPEQIVGKLCF